MLFPLHCTVSLWKHLHRNVYIVKKQMGPLLAGHKSYVALQEAHG